MGKYDPEDLPLDILAVKKVGLGQHHGTRVVDRYSILGDDDVSPKVVKRVLALCRLFLSKNVITIDGLRRDLGIENMIFPGTVSVKEYNRLREDMEALKVQAEFEERRANNEKIRADNLLNIVNSQQGKIKDYDRLREEYESLKVNAENEGRRADGESIKANNLQATVNSLHGKVRDLETQLSSSKSSTTRLEKEVEELEARVENSKEVLDDVIETIEERTKFEFDPSDDTMEGFIAEVVQRLLEDNEALKAGAEE